MTRAIDHLVVAAHDLDEQAALYRRLGFQVGARNRHPWGTENHIVQFGGSFLELIALGADFSAAAPMPGVFSFGGFLAKFLERRQGLAMLALNSLGAEADRLAFAKTGIGDFSRFDFGRKGRRPDGLEVEVAFSLAFAECAALPNAGFFVSQHHFPQNFWSARAQIHPNGAIGIAGIVVAHERPPDLVKFFQSFVGGGEAREVAGGLAVDAQRASIEILTPAAIVERWGADVFAPDGPPLAAMRLRMRDLAVARGLLEENGTEFTERGGDLIVGPRDALGVAIVFEN
jgi:Glyoxalase-like domain